MKELKVYDSPEQKRQEKDGFTSNHYSFVFKGKDLVLQNKS